MYKAALYIENQRVDLFDDEPISVISSVQNISDISRIFNDFSQSFSVPASNNNNKIFKHYYNASINNGFDARIRHEARLEINAIPFKNGTIRLEKAVKKNNVVTEYRLTFFGQLIDLKDVIGDDYLSSLDLSIYDIAYNSDNVITGLTTGYSAEDYVFPLISTERQWFYNSNISNATYTDTLANIAWNGATGTHGLSWTSLRPALKVMRIIEAIEAKYGITFSRDFFGNVATENLYLWMANADSEEALTKKTRITDYNSVDNQEPQVGTWDNTTGSYNPVGVLAVKGYEVTVNSSDGVLYTVQLMNNDTVLAEETGTGNISFDHSTPGGVSAGSSIYLRLLTTADKAITSVSFRIIFLEEDNPFLDETLVNVSKTGFSISGSTAQVLDFIPKIKTIDFLTSIIKLMNLTIVPNTSTDFMVETLDAWYADGNIYDISKYVDREEVPIERPTIYKEISFKYQEPSTILGVQYNKTNNVAYGDLETKLKDANGNPLDGEEFEIEVDFEQMVYERLLDLDDDSNTNIVYGLSLDEGLGQTTPEPHILYVKKVNVSSNPLSVVNDTGNDEQVNTFAFMPSHLDSTGNYSTTFGSELDEHTNVTITNTLFANYYQDYITDSFSSKRRKYNYKALLPIKLLNSLKLNDRLVIDGDRYIINQMTTEVTSGGVNFELLNDIYNIEVNDTTTEEETPPNQTPREEQPTTGRSHSMSATGGNTLAEGCALTQNTVRYYDGAENYPTLGDTVYTDVNLTTAFAGGNKYYKINDNRIIRITNIGAVIDIYDCTAGAHL